MMIRSLFISYLKMVQDMWNVASEDVIVNILGKFIAMLLVAIGMNLIGVGCFLAVLCIFNPLKTLCAVCLIAIMYAITYGIVHVKLSNDENDN